MKVVRPSERKDSAAVERALDRLREYVREQGLRASDVRETIARAALRFDGHFSVEQLVESIPGANTATVYRVLPVLVEAKLLREAPGRGDGQRYERDFEREHHDHLVCTSCGKTVEFHFEVLDTLERDIAARFDFQLTNHVHSLYGLCAKCSKAKK